MSAGTVAEPADLDRRVLTAREAEQQLGIPASSIRAWASQRRLFAVSIDADGQKWYKLRDVIELMHTTKRRAHHIRSRRAALVEP